MAADYNDCMHEVTNSITGNVEKTVSGRAACPMDVVARTTLNVTAFSARNPHHSALFGQ
jgi:hypothetical protein